MAVFGVGLRSVGTRLRGPKTGPSRSRKTESEMGSWVTQRVFELRIVPQSLSEQALKLQNCDGRRIASS